MKCQIKKGIFVLHTCDEKAFVVCGSCRKSVCPQHIDKSSAAQIFCVECAANALRQQKTTLPPNKVPQQTQEVLDDFWYYSTRSNFYHTYNYRPFDQQDYKSFDKIIDENSAIDDLDGESGSFLDS